jgi:hypothetical protein
MVMKAFRGFVAAAVVTMVSAPVLAKDCPVAARVQGTPGKVPTRCEVERLPQRPDQLDHRALKGEKGFLDLGNGTSVRITGRVRGDTLYRR